MSTAAAVAILPKNGTPPPVASPLAKPTPHATKFVASEELELALIEPDPHNPRKDFPKEEMQELIASVTLWGVRQAIEVRPAGKKYRIVAGERRYRAAKAVGLEKVPVVIRQLTDLEASDVQMDENLKRADLSPLEIAGGYQRQIDLGRTMDQVCERAGKKRSAVYSAVALLKLGAEGRKAVGEKVLDAETAKLLVKYVPKSMQAEQVKVLTGEGKDRWGNAVEPMSYREAADYLRGFVVDLTKAPWELKQEGFKCAAVSCAVCPSRAGNTPDLYGDVKPDTCVDRVAYAGKLHLFRQAEMAKKGVKLLSPDEAPVDELFWNNNDVLRPDSGYVEPKSTWAPDAKQRSVSELLEPEQVKKLTVVALNHKGDPVELLKLAGLEKELKKAGKLVSHEQQAKERAKKSKAKEAKAVEKGPDLGELTRDVLMGKCVAAVEDKGHLASPLLKLIACKLLDAMTWEQRLSVRRGLKGDGGVFGLDAKKLDQVFPKLTPGKLAGLIFEAVFDDAFEVGDVDELDTVAADVCEVLGVDPAKVAAEVKAGQDAKKALVKDVHALTKVVGEAKAKHAPKVAAKPAKKKAGGK